MYYNYMQFQIIDVDTISVGLWALRIEIIFIFSITKALRINV